MTKKANALPDKNAQPLSRKGIGDGPFSMPDVSDRESLVIEGLRQNNLKNFNLSIPHNRITAVVGLSGSGKSSLAFDTLFAEGRWRFIESLSTYTRLFLERMDRPEVDAIRNIRPAIAVEQKNPVRTSRSTVATATELYDYLRLLFARVGKLHCPECGAPVEAADPPGAAAKLFSDNKGKAALIGFTLQTEGKTPDEIAGVLLKKGFIRVKAGAKVCNIAEEKLPAGLPGELQVVTDRLTLKEDALQRLTEALETAFREGAGNAWAEVEGKGIEKFSKKPACPKCASPVERPSHISLSFNHPVGACPECKGFGNLLKYDIHKVIPDEALSLNAGAVEPWTKPAYTWWFEELKKHAGRYDLNMDKPFGRLSQREKKLVLKGAPDFDGIDDFFEYLDTKKYKLHIKVFTSRYKGAVTCPACDGARLKKNALSLKINGRDIAGMTRLTIKEALAFFLSLENGLTAFERDISKEVLKQIKAKLGFMDQTGLGYITLDRLTKTLSGGEAQRVTIATQLAASLTGVLYILDEPSIGLHPVDIDMLSQQMRKLSSRGNTVVIVEHDRSMIRSSDYILELGPGSGERGGRLVWAGKTEDFLAESRTITADYLCGRALLHTPRWRRSGSGKSLILEGASGNNLKDVTIKIPLKTLTCVTGVSGSGKSTLIKDTLYNILASEFGERFERPLEYASIEGTEHIRGVRLVDQTPVGRTPRSNPITYIGGFDDVRQVFASLPSARSSGLTPGDFSFNTPGGRCEACKGEGVEKLEMYFLPDVYIKCAGCNGRRYKQYVLNVKYKGKSVFDCLDMTFEEAIALFQGHPAYGEKLHKKFSIIKEVGLGYLKLGQSALTLSGGEAQRLKIAKELIDEGEADMLYIFDEPTTGLHMDDVKRLLSVLGRLVDAGNTVLIIEHNLDCVKTADHVIDLGPGGGEAGGRVVASGTPEEVARTKGSVTGRYLKDALA